MKPAPFELYSPSSVAEAVDLLAEHDGEAKLLAGGQSLVPLMNFRLAQPEVLVDLGRVAPLRGIRLGPDDVLHVGAMTRHRDLEHDADARRGWALLDDAVPTIGHVAIRNRGTIGGSLAHADPAAELPAVLVALGGAVITESPRGSRRIAADDFFQMIFTTALEPDELITEVVFPPVPVGVGDAWLKFARRHGDFAVVGVAARVELLPDGACGHAALVLAGAASVPLNVAGVDDIVRDREPSDGLWTELGAHAARGISPPDDLHGSAAYRRHLVSVLSRRALATAHDRASPKRER